VEIHRIKSFDFLVVNSSSFDFDEKKISYFSALGKELMLKKIILTDSPEAPSLNKNSRLILTSDPSDFLKAIESLV
jgi:hypothetical protein